ncbi:MAG TPA: 50S ribosomal protein L24 [Candidatus Saccharimonadales bacterium]|jgi:large subunit ribosomal protein L24|nr:50S ribosomal protein L24 [Candidatus Saccharimonadales bacterium]
MKIKKGDEVIVLGGKDRYDRGKVQEVDPRKGTVTVTGVNTSKRHTKANPNKNIKGGIVDQLVPLSVGKVMLVCPHCNKPARVGYRMDNDTKERFCKNCGQGLVTEGAES